MPATRVLRVLRGRVRPSDAPSALARVQRDVLPATASLGGLAFASFGVRDVGSHLAVGAVSIWRNRDAIVRACAVDRPSPAFDALLGLVTFDRPREFDLVLGDPPPVGPLAGGAIGLMRFSLPSAREPEALHLIAAQLRVLRADGLVRALLVGRHAGGASSDVAAVALWPDREAAAAFLAERPAGPGLDPRLMAMATMLRFDMFDVVDPESPVEVGVPAVLVIDGAATIVDASPGVERVLGVPGESLLGRGLQEVLPEEERARWPARWQALLADGFEQAIAPILGRSGAIAVRQRALANVPWRGLHSILLERPRPDGVRDVEAAVRRALGDWPTSNCGSSPGVPAASERSRPRVRDLPRLVTVPSADAVFARFVELSTAAFGVPTMRRLQLHLRGLYPRAVVHCRDLAGEAGETWYVFRDGRIGAPAEPAGWWRRAGVATGALDAEGRILEVNEATARLYGVAPEALVGRDVRTLGAAGTFEDLGLLLRLVFDEPVSDSTVRVLTRSGDPLDLALHAERDGDLMRYALAPLPAEEPARPWFAPLCLPPWDDAFIARVEDLIGRLAIRNPMDVADELAARLRVSHPAAAVRPLGRLTGFGATTEVLLVYRDGEPNASDPWWTDPGVALLRIQGDRYVDANEAALALHGVSRDEMLASGLGHFGMSGDERLLMRDILHRTGSLHTTARILRADGTEVPVEFHASLVAADPPAIEVALRATAASRVARGVPPIPAVTARAAASPS